MVRESENRSCCPLNPMTGLNYSGWLHSSVLKKKFKKINYLIKRQGHFTGSEPFAPAISSWPAVSIEGGGRGKKVAEQELMESNVGLTLCLHGCSPGFSSFHPQTCKWGQLEAGEEVKMCSCRCLLVSMSACNELAASPGRHPALVKMKAWRGSSKPPWPWSLSRTEAKHCCKSFAANTLWKSSWTCYQPQTHKCRPEKKKEKKNVKIHFEVMFISSGRQSRNIRSPCWSQAARCRMGVSGATFKPLNILCGAHSRSSAED